MNKAWELWNQLKSISDDFTLNEEPLKVERLTGDAGLRVYYRFYFFNKHFFFNSKIESNTFLLCYWPFPEKGKRGKKKDFNSFQSYIYLSNFLAEAGVYVPKILGKPGKDYYLLEDLGKVELEVANKLEYDLLALDGLRKLHSLSSLTTSLPLYSIAWRYKELLFFLKHLENLLSNSDFISFIKPKYNFNLESYKSKHKLGLKLFFKQLAIRSYGNSAKFVPNHRDFHSRNILVYQGQTFFIDYQDAFLAPAEYDLVSFIWDPYRKIAAPVRSELIQYYYKTKNVSQERKTLLYHNALQRLYKALGTYLFQINTKNKIRYLPSLSIALQSIKQLPSDLQQELTFPKEILYLNELLDFVNTYLLNKFAK